MSKYSDEFKLEIINRYKDGEGGFGFLARKYNVSSKSLIYKWVLMYDEFGLDGIKRRSENRKYSTKFKLSVIEYKKVHNASLTDTAKKFKINHPSTIGRWEKQYRDGGEILLSRKQGKPSMNKKKENKSELEKLQEENELLRLENR